MDPDIKGPLPSILDRYCPTRRKDRILETKILNTENIKEYILTLEEI